LLLPFAALAAPGVVNFLDFPPRLPRLSWLNCFFSGWNQ
jgi:hypothetical protein